MVRIIDYKTRTKEDGTEFCLLVVQGGIEMIKSKNLLHIQPKSITFANIF